MNATFQPMKPLPFEEAAKFFGDKVVLTPKEFAELRDDAKSQAFSVAGLARLDAVTDVFNAMYRAVEFGTSFSTFKADIRDIIERKGWTGKAAWRVDTIFRTNIQTAYSVGKWDQLRNSKGVLGFVQYDAVNDSRTRPTHAAMDGKVFPANDPIWDRWWPPNGFRCRCTTRLMSEAEVKARGLAVDSGANWDGQMVDVGNGGMQALMPDPRFDSNPGKVRFGQIDSVIGQAAVPVPKMTLKTYADFGLPPVGEMDTSALPLFGAADDLPRGKPSDFYDHEFMSELGIAREQWSQHGWRALVKDGMGDSVIVSSQSFHDETGTQKLGRPDRQRFARVMARAIRDPEEIWLVPMQRRNGQIILRKRYVYVARREDGTLFKTVVVMDVDEGAWTGVSAHPLNGLDALMMVRTAVLFRH